MNVREAVQRLLLQLSTEERSIPEDPVYPGRVEAALSALNGAAQEIATRTSVRAVAQTRSAVIHAPASLTVTLTADATTATIPKASWSAWMEGCSIRVGEAVWNRIVTATDGDTLTTLTLLDPWVGISGAFSSTVYADAVLLATDFLHIETPVFVVDDAGTRTQLTPAALTMVEWTTPDRPTMFDVDSWNDVATATGPRCRLLFAPPPSSKLVLRYRAKIPFGGWTTEDLDESDSPTIPIPAEMVEMAFLPIALQRFTAQPFFRNDASKEEIGRQFQVAMGFLESYRTNKRLRVEMTP